MANIPDYEDNDDIVEYYENKESDNEHDSLGVAEEATSDNEETARRIDPSKSKTHTVRNPVPKLNTERLKGTNGIHTIEKYFEGFKFYGKGHEKTDLDRIMKRLEHWSYRLFPKYHFDDFLTRVEQLGTKKDLQVFMKKYRLDTFTSDDDLIIHDNMDKEEDQQESAPLDDFDLLITEQIEKQKQAEARASISIATPSTSNEDAFDELLMQSNNVSNSQIQYTSTANDQLSDEVKKRIEKNKQLAIQKRFQKQKEREEIESKKTKLIESTNIEILNENNYSTVYNGTDGSQVDNMQSQIDKNINEAIASKSENYLLSNEELITDRV